MKGTPGGIVEMLGGDVAYLCLAIDLAFAKDVRLPGKIRRALPKVKAYRNPSRSSWIEHSLPDRPVLSGLPASRRADVFRTKNKRLANRSRGQCRSGGGEKPYALAH
jgi:hypothetical protein